MRVNWHICSGVYRNPDKSDMWGEMDREVCYPTVVIDVNLNDWALPLSIHGGGPLLSKPGLTFRVGPVNIGWSRL